METVAMLKVKKNKTPQKPQRRLHSPQAAHKHFQSSTMLHSRTPTVQPTICTHKEENTQINTLVTKKIYPIFKYA